MFLLFAKLACDYLCSYQLLVIKDTIANALDLKTLCSVYWALGHYVLIKS